MKTYLFDSDILIDYFNRQQKAVFLVEKLNEVGNIVISVISITELRSGWDNERATIYLQKLYNIFPSKLVTQEIAEQAGRFRKDFSKKGKTLSTTDALIAATAVINNYTLVTRNVKDFPMHELSIYPNSYEK